MEVFRMIVWVVAILAPAVAGFKNVTIPPDYETDVTYFQRNPDAFLNNFGFMNLGAKPGELVPSPEETDVTCGGSSSADITVWHSPDYPEETTLPYLCTLNLTPPPNTCAFRVTFDDLDFNPELTYADYICPDHLPSFKMSHADGITTSLCTNLTSFEGIIEVDPEDKGIFVLLLTFTSKTDFKFKITATAVSCADVITYKSPNVCGIKNEVPSSRSGTIPIDLFRSQEEAAPRDESEEPHDAEKAERRRPAMTKRTLLKALKKKNDIYSKGLVRGLQSDKIKVKQQKTRMVRTEEAGIGEWPWMVVVNKTGFFKPDDYVTIFEEVPCTGVLVDETHVLVTAACILHYTGTNAVPVSGLTVLVGEHDLTTSDETIVIKVAVSKVTLPLTYSPCILKDDLAVLELAQPVTFNTNIRPVCLPMEYNVFKDDTGVVTGWGTDTDTMPVTSLQRAEVSTVDEPTCNNTIQTVISFAFGPCPDTAPENIILDDYICTESVLCPLDFGIPLVKRDQTGAYVLVGMATAINMCFLDFPSVFTKVAANSNFLNVALV